MKRTFLWVVGGFACVWLGALPAAGDSISVELERSVNGLEGWVPVAVRPGMISGDGRILMPPPQPVERMFLRLKISMGAGVPTGFSLIPSGDFLMGSGADEASSSDDVPQHGVTLTRPYFMERTEVTFGDWERVRTWALLNGYTDLPAGQTEGPAGANGDYPVFGVNWYDAVKWLNARSEMEGRTPVYSVGGAVFRTGEGAQVVCAFEEGGYRLPTEAEWEYACRAGTSTDFFTGPLFHTWSDPAGRVNYEPNLEWAGWYGGFQLELGGPRPVGLKEPNSFGLYDTHGNVWEWCWDWHATYGGAPETDPTGPAVGTRRILRGGDWSSGGSACRSAHRESLDPADRVIIELRVNTVGFRAVRTVRVLPYESRILRLSGDLAFGEVEVGRTAVRQLSLKNEGNDPLLVTGITGPAGFSTAFAGHIPPGATQIVEVYFQPFAVGYFGSELLVEANTTGGESTWPVSGFGIAASAVYIAGGYLPELSTLGALDVDAFHLGRFEVTLGEWLTVRTWGEANGYEWPSAAGVGCAADHPVHTLNWFDALKWSNAKSEMEGLRPAYRLSGTVYRAGEAFPDWDMKADGWRLPTEMEWEFAARGGVQSAGYTYSGSNTISDVAWYYGNSSGSLCPLASGRGTWPVGLKLPNELGLYDMSGGVFERCWDTVGTVAQRRGGSWHEGAYWARVFQRNTVPILDRSNGTGFRVARSVLPGFVSIPSGTFTMGSPPDEPGRSDGEEQREVEILRPFRMHRTEVTLGQWEAVREWALVNGYTDLAEGWGEPGAGPNHPVMPDWPDAIKWLNAWSEKEGRKPAYTVRGRVYRTGYTTDVVCDFDANGYRLPTEEEWEYACRAGTQTAFYTGPVTYPEPGDPLDPALDRAGWYEGNTSVLGGIREVGGKEPNAFGLYDMHGNAWEWCWDSTGPAGDPWAGRIIRGGGYWSSAAECRSAHRSGILPIIALWSIGFRPVVTMPADEVDVRHLAVSGEGDFGQIEPGTVTSGVIHLTNEGTRLVTVHGLEVPIGFSASWSGTLAPGSSVAITVQFAPTAEGAYGGSLQVLSNAQAGTTSVTLSGHAVEAGFAYVQGGTLPAFWPSGTWPGWYSGWGYPSYDNFDGIGPIHTESFLIGHHEVTAGEWQLVYDWAVDHGYEWDQREATWSASDDCGDDYPARQVNFYDVLKWCNAKSEMEGRMPAYWVEGEVYRSGEHWEMDELYRLLFTKAIEWNPSADGYRIPTEREWEFAARGGVNSQGYQFSGSHDPHAVGWFEGNSANPNCPSIDGLGPHLVGTRLPNELGLYDFSGNVWEWCWKTETLPNSGILRGGCFRTDGYWVVVGFRLDHTIPDRYFSYGFRLARNVPP